MWQGTGHHDKDFFDLLGQWHRPGHDVEAGRGLCSGAIMRSPGRQKKMTDATHPFAQPEDMNFKFRRCDFCHRISIIPYPIRSRSRREKPDSLPPFWYVAYISRSW